ncbi:TnsA endonuclease N-terminal domain-containing protein [Tardiphaga sp. 172_B4_N1_3]|uniref:TnsA endonuclease N-terminal domain-containing protein n=1 Tax=Tardiphaga sp. 172_B4_N1_3 TaxID=3240787 RepID=UPI003F8A3514
MNYDNPPARSLASRFPALKSRETCRGFAIFQNRIVHFESHLELIVLFMLALRPETAKIIEQPTAITYRDGDVLRRHTFDFLVITRDGRHVYVAVKPAARVERSRIKRTLGLIVAQLPPNSNVSVHLVTDADFTYADRYNATQAFDFCRFPTKEHDEKMATIVAEIVGSARIADLVAFSGLGAMGFRSIVRLIVNGQLAAVHPRERITYASLVRSAPAVAPSES